MTEQEENIITISLDCPWATLTEEGKMMFDKLKEDWDKMKEEETRRLSHRTSESFTPHNPIDKPSHYIGLKGLETEEVLRNFIPRYEDSYVGHRVASAMEYLVRAPLKNGLEDLKKARYNLDQAISHIEGENNEDKPIQGRNE